MIQIDKRLFNKARSHKIGKMKMEPLFQYFSDKIEHLYDLSILTVIYDQIDIGPHKGRPRLNIIFEDQSSSDHIHKDRLTIKPHVQKRILKIFAEAVCKFELEELYPTENIHLISDIFSDEAMNRAALKVIEREATEIADRFSKDGLWMITGMSKVFVIFFTDEKKKQKNFQNGICDSIREECFRRVKAYDEFDYFTKDNFEVHFDSKENLDNNYEGNLFYYFR